MKNLSIPVSDGIFEKFTAIQKKGRFPNQSDCLEHIVEVAYREETKEDRPQ